MHGKDRLKAGAIPGESGLAQSIISCWDSSYAQLVPMRLESPAMMPTSIRSVPDSNTLKADTDFDDNAKPADRRGRNLFISALTVGVALVCDRRRASGEASNRMK